MSTVFSRRVGAVVGVLSALTLAGCAAATSLPVNAEYQTWYQEQLRSFDHDAGAAGAAEPGGVTLADTAAGSYNVSVSCRGAGIAHITVSANDQQVGEVDGECKGSSQMLISVPQGEVFIRAEGDDGLWWWTGLSFAETED